jgi:diguanylate cyclase (GGDEF)-like protein
MPDVDPRYTPDGQPVDGPAGSGARLLEELDTGSREALLDAVAAPGVPSLELITLDGRVLDAVVEEDGDAARVRLRDVSRYARATEQLGSMAVSLARRNRDLKTLHEAAAELDTTLELAEIGHLTARLVGEYLDAERVEVAVLGERFVWPDDAPEALTPAAERHGLSTARGGLGSLRWWREGPLLPNEAETLPLLISRAAIGLDHALLLSSARQRAARDELTGLYNRAGARQALARLVAPFPVALLDLDHFKAVNDEHGHAEGDRVLREVAEILRPGRETDVKARWGGEEFLVALDHATPDDAERWLVGRLAEVRSTVAVAAQPVTFSAGVAHVREGGEQGFEDALRRADAALYRAKALGRDRVERESSS